MKEEKHGVFIQDQDAERMVAKFGCLSIVGIILVLFLVGMMINLANPDDGQVCVDRAGREVPDHFCDP